MVVNYLMNQLQQCIGQLNFNNLITNKDVMRDSTLFIDFLKVFLLHQIDRNYARNPHNHKKLQILSNKGIRYLYAGSD